MLSFNELKKGAKIILDGEPYEILEHHHLKVAQRRAVLQTKIRNLISGNMLSRNFHQGDAFEEAEISKFEAKFLYCHRDRYFFLQTNNPAKRFELSKNQLGEKINFLKPGQEVTAQVFQEKIVNIALPIKIQLKVIEAPPALKGDSAQSPTKTVVLETGAKINTPLFIKEGDLIEINTETGEYVKRIQ